MSRVLRLLITCLLAGALPWQGVAAATMLWCGGSPLASLAQAAEAAPAAQAHDHLGAGHAHVPGGTALKETQGRAKSPCPPQPGPGGAQQGHADTMHHPDAHAAGPTDAHDDSPGAHHGCVTCAACCAAAALPAMPAMVPAPPSTQGTRVLPPQAGEPAFVTDGPERPPRPLA